MSSSTLIQKPLMQGLLAGFCTLSAYYALNLIMSEHSQDVPNDTPQDKIQILKTELIKELKANVPARP